MVGDLDDRLNAAAGAAPDPAPVLTRLLRRQRRRRLVAVSAVLAVVVAAGGVGLADRLDDDLTGVIADEGGTPSSTTTSTETVTVPDVAIDVGELPPTRTTPPPLAVAVTSDGRLVVVDTSTGAELRELAHRDDPRAPVGEGGPSVIDGVAVTPDGQTVWFSTCCEPAGGSLFRVPIDGTAPEERVFDVYDPAVSASTRFVAGVTSPGVLVHDLVGDDSRLWWDDRWSGDYQEVAWSPDGQRMALRVHLDGQLLLLDTRHFAFLEAEPADTSPDEPRVVDGGGWSQPAFARDGTLVAAHTEDGARWTRRTVDWDTGRTLSDDPLPSEPLGQCYDRTGEWLLTVLKDPGDAGGHVIWNGPGGLTGSIPGTYRVIAW
jgi:hypothetical protein